MYQHFKDYYILFSLLRYNYPYIIQNESIKNIQFI